MAQVASLATAARLYCSGLQCPQLFLLEPLSINCVENRSTEPPQAKESKSCMSLSQQFLKIEDCGWQDRNVRIAQENRQRDSMSSLHIYITAL